MNAIDLYRTIKQSGTRMPFVIVTGKGDEESAVAALHLGVYDYIVKDDDYHIQLPHTVENAIERFRLDVENENLTAELQMINQSLAEKIVQSTEELRKNEGCFRSLIENASDIITILDGNGIVRYESPSIERVLGYSPDELVGQSIFELIHPNDLPTVAETFASNFATPGISASAEFRIRHKDNSWRTLEAIGKSAIDENGQLTGISDRQWLSSVRCP